MSSFEKTAARAPIENIAYTVKKKGLLHRHQWARKLLAYSILLAGIFALFMVLEVLKHGDLSRWAFHWKNYEFEWDEIPVLDREMPAIEVTPEICAETVKYYFVIRSARAAKDRELRIRGRDVDYLAASMASTRIIEGFNGLRMSMKSSRATLGKEVADNCFVENVSRIVEQSSRSDWEKAIEIAVVPSYTDPSFLEFGVAYALEGQHLFQEFARSKE